MGLSMNMRMRDHVLMALSEAMNSGAGTDKLGYKIRLYDGVVPASPDDALTGQVVIAEVDRLEDLGSGGYENWLVGSDPQYYDTLTIFGSMVNTYWDGVTEFSHDGEITTIAAGTVSFVRWLSYDETCVMQADVGLPRSGAGFILSRLTFGIGETILLQRATVKAPSF